MSGIFGFIYQMGTQFPHYLGENQPPGNPSARLPHPVAVQCFLGFPGWSAWPPTTQLPGPVLLPLGIPWSSLSGLGIPIPRLAPLMLGFPSRDQDTLPDQQVPNGETEKEPPYSPAN